MIKEKNEKLKSEKDLNRFKIQTTNRGILVILIPLNIQTI